MNSAFNGLFMYVSVLHRSKSRGYFNALGLSDGQPKVLKHLVSHEGISQKELAEYCHVRPATMTALLRKMLADGLVFRKSLHAENGKRVFGIYLTDAGRELSEQVVKALDSVSAAALAGFSEEEVAELNGYLERICGNLREDAE